jgi:UDP-glucose 4-epimerase
VHILVTGGAGYIGSHICKALRSTNHTCTVYDDLSSGHIKAVKGVRLVIGDLKDYNKLDKLFKEERFDAVIHCAGKIVVSESVADPLKYYTENSLATLGLLDICKNNEVNRFVFSSTAAVYGKSISGYFTENDDTNPINPYGRSKLFVEQMMKDLSACSDFNYVALRYFNVAGADPDGEIGQSFPGSTHLIKIAVETAVGVRSRMSVFGNDYPTTDGTCIRDYVHVSDLADAHVLALDYLKNGGESDVFNCSYGHGYSVAEIVDEVNKTYGPITVDYNFRRLGDPHTLIGSCHKIKEHLKWSPKYNSLKDIISTAYYWEKNKRY